MPTIRTLPDDIEASFDGEANVLQCLLQQGIPIAHACGGAALCSTCRIRVVDGGACHVRTEAEAAIAERLKLPDDIRLACQLIVTEDVCVQRLVLDSVDESIASQLGAETGSVGCDAELAVLFADVVGYTALADALPAYDTIHVLNRFFESAERTIEAAGGRVNNYMGDAVMALFGPDKDPALASVRAGVGLLEVAESLDEYVESFYGRAFGIRVGVHYGSVVVGALGGASTRRETAIGDAVNVASRVEGANKETGTRMLASDEIRSRVGDGVRFGESHDLRLRGKDGCVTVHAVLGLAVSEA